MNCIATRLVALATFIFCISLAEAAANDGKYFDSNGVQIHYLDIGSGEPVVLMHGLNGSYQRWIEIGATEKLVVAGYRVLALDARAHGKSGTPHDPAEYGPEMSRDIARLMDHVGIDKAHIVGYSMGASIVGKLRDMQPDRFLTLSLGGRGWNQSFGPTPVLSGLADSLERGEGFIPFYETLYPDWSDVDRAERSKRSVGNLADLQATIAMLRGWNFGVTEDSLRSNTTPTLAIIGSKDPLKPSVDALDGVMPHVEIVVLQGADHTQAFRRPEYIDSVISFLAKHEAN